ncbi:MAG: hypothetical protein U1E58_08580 [Tabrizicola sp.]
MTVVLMLGSAPMVTEAATWPRAPFDRIVAINNAWRVRGDWDDAVFPWDFPVERQPAAGPGQALVTEAEFVPAQNRYGGFVYAGATMAFTAGYWALDALRPSVLAVFGCDMHYPKSGLTHFYGIGTPDPLRSDITLRSLEAKSARLMVMAAMQSCAVVNLSAGPSRLIFPRAVRASVAAARPVTWCPDLAAEALALEAELGYEVPSGRYWEESERFDPAKLDQLDRLWLQAATLPLRQTA